MHGKRKDPGIIPLANPVNVVIKKSPFQYKYAFATLPCFLLIYICCCDMRIARAPAAIPLLHTLTISQTPNGFTSPPRGWNSFGLQANPATNPQFVFNQANVTSQCDILATIGNGFNYCSLDSGWSVGGNGDEFGRIIPDTDSFPNITGLADHLHREGLKLGVYVVPGGFIADVNKTILGTNITIGSVCSGNNGLARCNWNYTQDGVQQWIDSVVAQFASWGVDFIKLDFITPGSPDNGANLPSNETGEVIGYHNAIAKSGRQMRLDISWKLARDLDDFSIWETNADSFRTDQDINNSNSLTFIAWATVQRAIDNYRQYITLHTDEDATLSIYPDMDNMFIGNPENISGITDNQRYTIMNHWIGAAANLILGSDLTKLDATGKSLLSNAEVLSIADFTSNNPMRPRNPGTGQGSAQQLQAWIAGNPSSSGKAVVLLANYGPDQGQSGFNSTLQGVQNLTVSWSDLGISGTFDVRDVWKGKDLGPQSSGLNVSLDEGESWLVLLTKTTT